MTQTHVSPSLMCHIQRIGGLPVFCNLKMTDSYKESKKEWVDGWPSFAPHLHELSQKGDSP